MHRGLAAPYGRASAPPGAPGQPRRRLGLWASAVAAGRVPSSRPLGPRPPLCLFLHLLWSPIVGGVSHLSWSGAGGPVGRENKKIARYHCGKIERFARITVGIDTRTFTALHFTTGSAGASSTGAAVSIKLALWSISTPSHH